MTENCRVFTTYDGKFSSDIKYCFRLVETDAMIEVPDYFYGVPDRRIFAPLPNTHSGEIKSGISNEQSYYLD